LAATEHQKHFSQSDLEENKVNIGWLQIQNIKLTGNCFSVKM